MTVSKEPSPPSQHISGEIPSLALASAEAVQFKSKADLVYDWLRVLIVSGQLPPGGLIDQQQIADALGVSRMPLRQALLKLEADNLIELRPHRQAVVSQLSAHAIEEIYSMREALEAMLVRVAMPNLNEADWHVLAALQDEMRAAVERQETRLYVERDRVFHHRIHAAAGYQRALDETERLRDAGDRYVAFYASRQSRAVESLREHDGILAACKARDPDSAARLAAEHVRHGREVLLAHIREAEQQAPASTVERSA